MNSMNHRGTLKKLLGASIATLMLISTAQAFPNSHGDGHHRKSKFKNLTPEQRAAKVKKRFERMATKLELSATQKKQAEAIFAQHAPERQRLHAQAKKLRDTLKTQRQNNAAEANIEATHDQLYQVKKQLRQLRRAERSQMEAILTPEQRAKIADMKEKRMKKHNS